MLMSAQNVHRVLAPRPRPVGIEQPEPYMQRLSRRKNVSFALLGARPQHIPQGRFPLKGIFDVQSTVGRVGWAHRPRDVEVGFVHRPQELLQERIVVLIEKAGLAVG